MRILSYCLMPNHFHLVFWPYADGDLGRWMQWLMTRRVRRYHRHYGARGNVWQGRFKAFPIEQDEHLLTMLRYAERYAMRARLVRKAEHWHWSNLRLRQQGTDASLLATGPVALPANWTQLVSEPQTEAEVEKIE